MAIKINADNSTGLEITSDTSTNIDIQSNDVTKMSIGTTIDIQGNELVLDADADTSIHASTDDRIDFKTAGTDRVHFTSQGNVGVGTNAPTHLADAYKTIEVKGTDTNGSGVVLATSTAGIQTQMISSDASGVGSIGTRTNHPCTFSINNAEKMRLTNAAHGELLVSTTDGSPWNNNNSDPGCGLNTSFEGLISSARSGGDPLALNRMASDGDLLAFYRDGSVVGSISVSSGNVTYGAFTGNHPSRLVDNTNPTILKGTVIETIDTMCNWYELEFTTADGVPKHTEIVLPDDKSVGDNHTMNYLGESVTGKIIKRLNDKHTLCKISDTEDSARVYGVFADYSNGDEIVYNDMLINAVGTSVVRVASGVTVSAGDLLSSKGDGTAKLQGDDIIKTKTIGKVLSNVKQETYDDGSFTVPCALYCG